MRQVPDSDYPPSRYLLDMRMNSMLTIGIVVGIAASIGFTLVGLIGLMRKGY